MDILGSKFFKKKHTEKDKENTKNVEECGKEDIEASKFVGLFFSSHWCPPCRTFLPVLRDFYNEINLEEKKIEILFLSVDPNEEGFLEHYTTMPWLAIPFNDPRIENIKERFNVTGIPIFIILETTTGKLITLKGRKDVQEQGLESMSNWEK